MDSLGEFTESIRILEYSLVKNTTKSISSVDTL